MTASPLRFRDFELDPAQFQLRRAGHRIRLERKPLELLILLVEKQGQLVARDEIIQRVWGKDFFFDAERGINNAIRKIRSALNDESGQPRFVETVVGKGYRFIAPMSGASPVAPSSSKENTEKLANILRWPRALFGKGGLVTAGLLVAVLVIVVALNPGGFRQRLSGSAARIQSLAVLPLVNLSGDPAQEYFADGMTEAVIGRLSMIRGLRVISRTSVMRFKDTRMSAPEIAKTLHVDAVVEGSVIREGSRIRVTAQLIRGATDEHVWSETYDRELREVLALESDVAQSIARKVQVSITGEEHKMLAEVRSVSPEVYENYLKGRFALAKGDNRANVAESIGFFNQAISKDTTYAPSYLGLANAYAQLSTVFIGGIAEEGRPKVIQAARKALELDPELVEAHVLLGLMAQEQWHWADAEAEYRRALELRPNDAAAHSGLADWLISEGRTEEAVAERRRGRELDPLAISGSELAWALFYARRYDDAVQELHSVLAVKTDDAYALWILGFALIANHQPQEAVPVLEKGVSVSERSPAIVGLLVHAYAQAGRRPDALRLLAELKRRNQAGYVPAAAFVLAYLGLDEYDQSFVSFQQAYHEQSNILQFLKVHPFFDPIRGDPRFADLVRRVGLD